MSMDQQHAQHLRQAQDQDSSITPAPEPGTTKSIRSIEENRPSGSTTERYHIRKQHLSSLDKHIPETGYCQGMSDLLSPIISVIEDHEAFWCFVGFMRKVSCNFQLDEVGIRRQLGLISKIMKCKDSHLYRHLEKLKAEDYFLLYRMVVVLFRRELFSAHFVSGNHVG
ncbi:unnamed protein product [Amaranthus hypochondriacus]